MRKIVSTSNVLMGAPRIEFTRISVYDIISSLWYDRNVKEYSNDFQIKEMEIKNALTYCKDLYCKKNSVLKFCNGCVLDISDDDLEKTFNKIEKNLFIDENQDFYIAENIEDIKNENIGYKGWIRAEELFNEFYPSYVKSSKTEKL